VWRGKAIFRKNKFLFYFFFLRLIRYSMNLINDVENSVKFRVRYEYSIGVI
jgi:hypothetical protein